MDWNLVQLFVEIVDAGSLSEAARRRGITRSGISQRLKQLEQQASAQLLRRTTRDLQPTEIGLTLYEHGKRIAYQFEAANHEMQSLGKTLAGLVRVSVPPGIGQTLIAPALIAFGKTHPDLNLQIIFNNRLSNLIEAGVDIALQITNSPPQDRVARELCDVRWRFYSTPQYLATLGGCDTLDDLGRAAFLSTTGGRKAEIELISAGRTVTVILAPKFVSENVLFLRECTRQHMGISLLPHYIASDLLNEGAFVHVLPEFGNKRLGGKFFILTMPNHFPTAATEAVISLLRDIVLGAATIST